jgi:hypothetical protein
MASLGEPGLILFADAIGLKRYTRSSLCSPEKRGFILLHLADRCMLHESTRKPDQKITASLLAQFQLFWP